MTPRLLGGLTPRTFLRRHWQKRPLFVRGALPAFRGVVDEHALIALAARDDVESRVVERSGKRWHTAHGPFRKISLKKTNSTLLVSGVNLHVEAAEQLLRRFDFVPQARLDDVMVSFATRGGGVGPHVDSYDVFLLQGAGRRHWRVRGSDKRALEYLAETGDLLYLPPGWRHDGVALEPCFTYSIGFRAPRGTELGAAFLDWLHERGLPDAAYRDPRLEPTSRPAQIPREMIRFAETIVEKIKGSRTDASAVLGQYLTTPKPHVVFSPGRSKRSLARAEVQLDPKTQLLYSGNRFYLNGECFTVRKKDSALLKELADRRGLPGARLARAPLADLVYDWHRAGYVRLKAVT
jgi:50S ribosomal protein L16 3-hydroxylase